jgi:hypothetical protein
MIVIGLGSGRSGTASLAKLLNAQRDALCFHEMNPSCVRFHGTPRPILNTIDEFQTIVDGGDPSMLTVDLSRPVAAEAYDALCRMERVRLVGDIAFYYLSYVELIARHNPNVRFVCLKRDRQATIESWLRKSTIGRWPSKRLADRLASLITRTPYHTAHNPWMQHDGLDWAVDDVWDKCFPKFPGPTRTEAIAQYYDYYYAETDRLAALLPERFRLVHTDELSAPTMQRALLAFCGVAPERQLEVDAHVHRSRY